MRARITVLVLTAALVIYFVLLTGRAVTLIRTGEVVPVLLGIGVFLLPIIGIILTVMELRFGMAAEKLSRTLEAEGVEQEGAEFDRRASGRVDRDTADAHFAVVKARVEADPDNWRGWFALGEAYELAGDRKRARSAIRSAIALARQAPSSDTRAT